LEPADFDDGFNAARIVRVAGEQAALDALYDNAAYVGCSFGRFKVSVCGALLSLSFKAKRG
jgi:hypothetical protein